MTMQTSQSFTIVLPCYNPIIGWEETVVDVYQELKKRLAIEIDLVIVNDGSTKNVSRKEIDYLESKIPLLKYISYAENRGKGYALRKGVENVQNFPVVYTDIDFPYTTESFLSIYKTVNQGKVDVALGNRDQSYYENTPLVRKLISQTLRASFKFFLKLPTDDTQCGIKGFNEKGASLFLTTTIDRFLFDLEFVKLIGKRKLKYSTVHVDLKPNIVFSKVNPKILAKESFNFLKVLMRK